MVPQFVVKVEQFLLAGQLPLPQQIGGLLEIAFLGQRLRGDAPIFEPGAFAVDVADRRFRHRYIFESRSKGSKILRAHACLTVPMVAGVKRVSEGESALGFQVTTTLSSMPTNRNTSG